MIMEVEHRFRAVDWTTMLVDSLAITPAHASA